MGFRCAELVDPANIKDLLGRQLGEHIDLYDDEKGTKEGAKKVWDVVRHKTFFYGNIIVS